jgi:hypothetical protein
VYGVTPAAEVNFTTATDWTDVPTSTAEGGDLACSSGASCEVQSPTFWEKYRLTTIETETLKGSSLEPADSWALAQDYPTLNDSTTMPSLWLESITRTGEDGTPVTLPPVTFGPVPLANRVESTADLNDGYSIITRMRLGTITNETGGVVTVAYDTPPSSCTSGNFPAPDANTTLCYPDWWTPTVLGAPIEDWFNKYVVTGVTEQDPAGGGVPQQVLYTYSGAAWHYNDNPLTSADQVQGADLGSVARVPHRDQRDRHRPRSGDRDRGHLFPGDGRGLPIQREHHVGVADQHRGRRHGNRLQPVRRDELPGSSMTAPAGPKCLTR